MNAMNDYEDIPVLYEDESLIAVDKPTGLAVHKNDFMPRDADYLTKIIGQKYNRSVYNVHRLDAKTSGVILLAFSQDVAALLTRQFEQKQVSKRYIAIVKGNPGEGTFDSKVVVKKKSKFKKPAITHYRTLQTVDTALTTKDGLPLQLSIVEVSPQTGRWHQVRQHFARHRYDIIGDTHHGDFSLNRLITGKTGIKRLMLHAGELEFIHPTSSSRITATAISPEAFARMLDVMGACGAMKFTNR